MTSYGFVYAILREKYIPLKGRKIFLVGPQKLLLTAAKEMIIPA